MIIKLKLYIIHSLYQCVVIRTYISYPTVSSIEVDFCEVYGHFTVLGLCEAYGCFIAHLVGMILTIIKVKLCVIHSPHQCVVIGYLKVSSIKVNLCKVFGNFTVLEAYGYFIAPQCPVLK